MPIVKVVRLPLWLYVIICFVKFVFGVLAFLVIFAALASVLHAEEIPDAPKPQHKQTYFTVKHDADIASNFVVRFLDAYTTSRNLHDKCKCMHESILPNKLATSTTGMYLYSGTVAATFQFAAFEASKHGHQKISFILRHIDTAVDGEAVVQNEITYSHRKESPVK